MKKSFITALVAIFALGTTSVYGQFVNPVVGGNVTLTDPTNNVVIGPLPTTPTNLHVNSNTVVGSNSTTVLTIENSGTAVSKGSYLKFINNGQTFTIGTNSFPAPGSGMFHIGNLIHMSANGITFSSGYAQEYTGPFTSKYNFRGGRSAFDSIYSRKIGINMYSPDGYNFGVYGNSLFRNGKVVIGTTSNALPEGTHKLYVAGSIICEELVVKLQANWPDYVFAPTYKLMPLSQVKTYIAANNHLPNVPDACEVAENGVAAGEMLTIQMQKIEELTLYLIQMEERIKELEFQNKSLKNSNGQ